MSELPKTNRSALVRLIPLLLLLAMVGPLTLNILQPALPGLAKALDAPRETVQLTLSLYILGMAVAQLVAGPLADRFGRRPVILICLAIYIAASVAAAFALDISMLIIARVAQAIGATACLGLSRTIIADVSDRATTAKIIAYVTMVMVLAPMASPNIGAALDARYGWRAIFVFCALFGVAMLAIAALWLLETRPASLVGATYSAVARRTWALAKNRQFLRYVVLSSFASACFFIFLGATPHLIIEAMGRSPSEFSLWYIILGVGYALGNFTVARFTSWIGADRMMVAGNLLLLVGATAIAGLALVPVMHPAAVFVPAVLFTFGNGLVLPHSMAAAIQTDRNAGGAASGLVGAAQMFIGAAGSYIVAKLPGETALSMALMMLGCGVISLLATPRWRKA